MARNKKPRKAYKPKLAAPLPMTWKIAPSLSANLKRVPRQELEKMLNGKADASSWHTLTQRVDWGLFLAVDHFNEPEARDAMNAALRALVSIKDRHARLAKWGCSGEEYRDIEYALQTCDDMQDMTTRKEQVESLTAMYRVNNELLRRQKASA